MDLTERSQLSRWLVAQLLLTLVQSFALAVVVRLVMLSFGRTVSFPATWAIVLVAVAALRLQRLALPGTGARRRRRAAAAGTADARAELLAGRVSGPGHEPLAPLAETLDRRFRRLARHADRLTYAIVETRHFHSGVRPVLTELAADRLRRHWAIDMAAEPARAREVIGDDLWDALTTDRSSPPTAADLDRWLTTLEALSAETSAATGRLLRS